jgi:hypothetical protein
MKCSNNNLNDTVLALSDTEKRQILSVLVRSLISGEESTWPDAFPIEDDSGVIMGHYLPFQPVVTYADPEAEADLARRINTPGETLSIEEFFTPIRTREPAVPTVGS